VSPILTRPIREQLEHDRIIRQLQARYKRKHEVTINLGMEQNESVTVGELAVFPDLLLFSQNRSRRLEGTVEVETGESVNQLEALAEWGVFSKLKAPFYLYVPPQCIDSARRLCDEHQFAVAEIWTYHLALDQVRFTQVYRSPNAPKPAPAPRGGEKPAAVRRVPAPVAAAKQKTPVKAAAPRPSRTAAKAAARLRPARPAPPPRAAAAKPKATSAKPAAKAKAARKRR
jgi:hypothetical protein